MAFPKLERGQEVTIKAHPYIITMGYSRYYYGGDNYDGIKCIIQTIEYFNVVSPKSPPNPSSNNNFAFGSSNILFNVSI